MTQAAPSDSFRAPAAARSTAGALVIGLALVAGLVGGGCDGSGLSAAPISAACTAIGSQCQLPDGPLGVCQETPCGPGAARPCFKCTSQH